MIPIKNLKVFNGNLILIDFFLSKKYRYLEIHSNLFELDGIDLYSTHLNRNHLVQKLNENVKKNRFTLISASAASGKTSLLKLFADKMPFNYSIVHFMPIHVNVYELFQSKGIDLVQKRCGYTSEEIHVFLIDDAQVRYGEKDFWTTLFKAASYWIPPNIRFVIAASHMLSGGIESPVEFVTLDRIDRQDLLLNVDEWNELMSLSIGLPPHLSSDSIKEAIFNDTNGLIGAVRIAIESIKERFSKDPSPGEDHILRYFLSNTLTVKMARCFGSQHSIPVSQKLVDFLRRLFFESYSVQPLNLNDDDKTTFVSLKKAGILIENDQLIKFSSPMAKRYYSRLLYPLREENFRLPISMRHIILKTLSQLSPTLLRDVVSNEKRVPKEAVFQHLFMYGLAKSTPPNCSIHPELSKVFKNPNHANSQDFSIQGAIDFYLDFNDSSDTRFGIELLVNGSQIGDHLARFEKSGKYYPLKLTDYAVVDFRYGPVSNINTHPKRISVFFDTGDFSRCSCVFGLNQEQVVVNLSN